MLTVPRVLNRSLFLGLSWHNRTSVRSKLNHIKLLLLEKRQLANSHPPLSLGNAGTLQRDIGSNVGTYFAKTFIETNCHFQSLSKKRGAENFRLERKKNFEALPIDFFYQQNFNAGLSCQSNFLSHIKRCKANYAINRSRPFKLCRKIVLKK